MNDATSPVRRIEIAGDLTIYTAGDWRIRLTQEIDGAEAIELDLSHVSEIDAAGLQLLISARRQAMQNGGSLRVAACHPAVSSAVAFCRLGDELGLPGGAA